MDLIKLVALYYDKVNVIYCNPLHNQALLDRLAVFQQSGFLSCKPYELRNTLDDLRNFALERMFQNADVVNTEDYEQIVNGTDMCSHIYSRLFGLFSEESRSLDEPQSHDNKAVMRYASIAHLSFQLFMLYGLVSRGKSCISSNKLLMQWLNLYLQQSNLHSSINTVTPEFMTTLSATPILLPNYSSLGYDDVLEIRLKASAELQEMRCFLSELSMKYNPDDKQFATVKDFIERDIQRAVQDFERKVQGLRVGTIQRALKSMANPLTYAPMLTTFITDVPLWISAGLSMGLITAEAALEYSKQKKELKADPLYFTVKLQKYGKKVARK